MTARNNPFDEHTVLHELKQFLPALVPGRTFTHRNPLHAFQHLDFHDALRQASGMLGYQTSLSLEEYRSLYNSKRVKAGVLEKVLVEKKDAANAFEWQDKVLMKRYQAENTAVAAPRIGRLRAHWQKQYKTDPDARVHPRLFRILGNYLDHGIADWKFPVRGQGFLDSMREVESNSFVSAFNTPRARNLLLHTSPSIGDLLTIIVGDETLFKQYLFDQQFAHRGWSGLVATWESSGKSLPNGSRITLPELIVFELLMEIDVLDDRLGKHWGPLATRLTGRPDDLFAPIPVNEKAEVMAIWQEAVEWSYYEEVLSQLCCNAKNAPWKAAGPSPEVIHTIPQDSVCIVARPSVFRNLPTGHQAFLNSYDCSFDPDGEELEKILETLVPSLGAANLEYYFSRTNQAGPDADNAMTDRAIGLFGTAGNHGDLRTGLPADPAPESIPMRLLCVVEQLPDTVLDVIGKLNAAKSWLLNGWVHLVVADTASGELRVFKDGKMVTYKPNRRAIEEPAY